MPNSFFQFKQFTVYHHRCAMKVTTDACLFGAWVAAEIGRFSKSPDRLLDIGTGTGLLSLMVAQKNSGRIDAVEIDLAASEQASENVGASPWKEKISIVHQDVLQWQPPSLYDCIFSNPPFYEKELRSTKEAKNIAHHDEGLKLADLLNFIKQQLAEDGSFLLLLPAKRGAEAERLFAKAGLFFAQKVYVQQTLKHPPFRLMIQGCHKKVEAVTEQTISIRNEAGDYTKEFVRLLQDYYLYLSMAS
jgi:tRNA1Val (adenine37-N6)-methyltransferase